MAAKTGSKDRDFTHEDAAPIGRYELLAVIAVIEHLGELESCFYGQLEYWPQRDYFAGWVECDCEGTWFTPATKKEQTQKLIEVKEST